MKKSCKISIARRLIIFWLILVSMQTNAQQPAVYNINKDNGLSSNHVYCMLIDKVGYLWLGTTDGVYRYNGYSLRKYDYSDGLPNVDVWGLYEDKRGRIWLRTIAQQIGYIHNNKYHSVYADMQNEDVEIYPRDIVELNDGRIVINNSTTNIEGAYTIALIENDTLKFRYLYHTEFDTLKTVPVIINGFVSHTSDSFLHFFSLEKILRQQRNILNTPEKSIRVGYNLTNDMIANPSLYPLADKYIFYFKRLSHHLNLLDINSGETIRFDLHKLLNNQNEYIILAYFYNRSLYLITNKQIIIVDSNADVRILPPLSVVFQNKSISGFNSTFYLESKFWGTALASTDNGVYVRYDKIQKIRRLKHTMNDYIFLNNRSDTDSYWWNDKKNLLAIVRNGEIKKTIPLPELHQIRKIVPYDSTKQIILNGLSASWLYQNNTTAPLTNNIDTAFNIRAERYSNAIHYGFFNVFSDLLVSDNQEIYVLCRGIEGVKKIEIDNKLRKISYETITSNRFKNMARNRKSNDIICYSADKIFIYNLHTGFRFQLNMRQLKYLGINAIEKIAVDTNGNIFIKDYNSLKVFNYNTRTIQSVLKTYNLKQARVEIVNNKLMVAGNFGILKADIRPSGSIYVNSIFRNIKNIYYSYIHDVHFVENNILLKTDKGAYIYQFDTDNSSNIDDYKFVSTSTDSLFVLSYNDTLTLAQNTSVVNVDVIRPIGTGNLRIEYAINKSPYQHSENQVIIPPLEPGSYNTVSLIASDDSWRSKPLKFTIFIQPKWWQTNTAKKVIIIISLLSLIGFIYLIIITTRRIVNSNNERRNQRRELELKSIYSQINPHFIFNSLSTAQYFVRKNKNKEAFEHINQFSDLLRSYIKSSRAKYITIAEEIENLGNYLELQLTRFEEKFNYNITVDASVNPHTVKIPSLLLQPLVENALNHGIFHSETKGNLNISFKIDDSDQDTLICMVDDNGIGRQKSKELRGKIIRKADSYGTILIKELIDTFNKYEKINIEIEYIDKQLPYSGTTVVVRIRNHAEIL